MRPETTLFLLQSIDGKISFGECDELDFDLHIPKLPYASIGLPQYYSEEMNTDLWTMCSGKTLAKVGWNDKVVSFVKEVTIVVIDNNHITEQGLRNLELGYGSVILITKNKNRENWHASEPGNCVILFHNLTDNLTQVLEMLYRDFGCKKLTIQTGGTLNSLLLRSKLIDNLNIIIAPMLIGGSNTPTLVDGSTISCEAELLWNVKEFQLVSVTTLASSYIQLRYKAFR